MLLLLMSQNTLQHGNSISQAPTLCQLMQSQANKLTNIIHKKMLAALSILIHLLVASGPNDSCLKHLLSDCLLVFLLLAYCGGVTALPSCMLLTACSSLLRLAL